MDELKEKLQEAEQHLTNFVECLNEAMERMVEILDESVGGGGQGGDPDDDD